MNNDVFPNKFKAALAAKQVQIGCWSALSNPISTEVLGLAGFDWLVLDGEHAPNDISTFIPQLMALKGSASAPVVRVPTNEPVIIKRLLDIGFYNFLIPFVETKEEAVKRVAEPLSVTIEKAKKDINTAVIMAERNYGLHSSITVLILESVLANVRAGNATVAAMEFEQYKGELLKNG